MISFVQAHGGVVRFLRRENVRRHIKVALGPHRRKLVVIAILIVATSIVPLALPLIYRLVLDRLTASPPSMNGVLGWAAVVAVLGVTTGLASFALSRLALNLGGMLIRHLQVELYNRFQNMPIGFFARAQTGAILARLTHEPVTAESLFSTNLVDIAKSIVMLLGATIVLAVVNVWTIPLMLLLAPTLLLVRRLTSSALDWAMQSIAVFTEISVAVEQRLNVAGATVVRLYGDAEAESKQFETLVTRLGRTTIGIRSNLRSVEAFVNAFSMVAIAIAIGVGGYFVTQGQLSPGTLVLVLFYVNIIQQPVMVLATARLDLASALAGLERIFEVLEFPAEALTPAVPPCRRTEAAPTSAEPIEDALPTRPKGLAFIDVSFRHPEPSKIMIPSLGRSFEPGDLSDFEVCEITFNAAPGEVIAAVGPTGAGKSTIAALAAGLLRPDSGTIWVEGKCMDAQSYVHLRSHIALVTQDVYLFHDTVKANLTYGLHGIDHNDLVAACRAAQIHDRIYALPAGYNTIVGERGARLSGGERQRLALARAILRQPSVVILDEATAHLDNITESAVQEALVNVFADAARLVIAHRLSTIANADLILVIEQGRVVERGTEAALMSRGGAYARLRDVDFDR